MATSYTSDKKIGALDPITGSLSANDEIVVNKNGDTLKASMTDVEKFAFSAKTQVSPQTGDVVVIRRGTDIRQVTTENLLPNESVANAQIANNAAISHSKLATMSAASVLLGDANNVPTATAVTGDVTISNSGVTSISSGVVVDADINASAGINGSKIADGSVSLAKLVSAVQQALMPAGAVQAFAMNSAPSGWLACNGANVSRATYAALFAAIGTTYGAGDGSTTFGLPDLRGYFVRGSGTNSDGTASGTFAAKQAASLLDHTHSGTTNAETQEHTHSVSGTTSGHSNDHSHYVSGSGTTAPTGGIVTGGAGGSNANVTTGGGGYRLDSHSHTFSWGAQTGGVNANHTHTFSVTSGGRSATHNHTFSTGNPSVGGGSETRPANIAMLYCIKF